MNLADIVLACVPIGQGVADLYVDFGPDSAVVGFSLEDGSGRRRYFPMYGSTHRGLPSVRLQVLVTAAGDEMWVTSSWTGYPLLAYHRVGTDRYITRYGEMSSFDEPTPRRLAGTTAPIPPVEPARAHKVADVRYEG